LQSADAFTRFSVHQLTVLPQRDSSWIDPLCVEEKKRGKERKGGERRKGREGR